jgi:hypothetical protein
MGGMNVYMFLSTERDMFLVVKSSTPIVAKKRVKDIVLELGMPLFDWEFLRISKKESIKLLSQYELNTVYSNE